MEIVTFLMLSCAVFGASLLQAATGIGYGVIAGPILLVALNGSEAIQISTVHNLAIAIMMFPFIRTSVNVRLLLLLILGSICGILVGFFIQKNFDVWVLKAGSAVMVGFVAWTLARDLRRANLTRKSHGPNEATLIGLIAGIMGGMLAMPGPLAATWMSVRGYPKQEVRATILAFFIFAYGSNVALYAATSGFSDHAGKLTMTLAVPLILGVVAGNAISKFVSEAMFRRVLLAILTATIVVLLMDWLLKL
ncbi:MAG: sulfite exporter TauE/SafE family protein [Sulfitobacter sp.]